MSEPTPSAWRYRYVGDAGPLEWRYTPVEEDCNPAPEYEREPLYSADALDQAREEGRAEGVEGLKEELYRLARLEHWARRIINNARIWAQDAKDRLDEDHERHGDHSTKRPALRHVAGHLHRLIETLSQPLPEEGVPDRATLARRVEELESDRDAMLALGRVIQRYDRKCESRPLDQKLLPQSVLVGYLETAAAELRALPARLRERLEGESGG